MNEAPTLQASFACRLPDRA